MGTQISQSSTGLGFYSDIVFSLLVILAIIMVGAFALKRFQNSKFSKVKKIKLVDSIAVGSKEKIILLNLNNRCLLVGVTQNNITLLDNSVITDEEIEELSKTVRPTDNNDISFKKNLLNVLQSKNDLTKP